MPERAAARSGGFQLMELSVFVAGELRSKLYTQQNQRFPETFNPPGKSGPCYFPGMSKSSWEAAFPTGAT